MPTAAAYIRVSTEDQMEFSPDSQLRSIQAYALNHHIELLPAHIYLDEGISGRNTSKRPAFLQMIADAKRKPHPFDLILLWNFPDLQEIGRTASSINPCFGGNVVLM